MSTPEGKSNFIKDSTVFGVELTISTILLWIFVWNCSLDFLFKNNISEKLTELSIEEALKLIKKNSSVVLVSRAEVVDFDEFIELAENEYFRAAIDVYPVEPVPVDSTFRKKSNILFTSHVAGALDYSYKNIRDMMMNDIKKILNGMPPIHLQHADPDKAIMRRDRWLKSY